MLIHNSVMVKVPKQTNFDIFNGYFMRFGIKDGCLVVYKWFCIKQRVFNVGEWEYAFVWYAEDDF